jgi:hypothetical protein
VHILSKIEPKFKNMYQIGLNKVNTACKKSIGIWNLNWSNFIYTKGIPTRTTGPISRAAMHYDHAQIGSDHSKDPAHVRRSPTLSLIACKRHHNPKVHPRLSSKVNSSQNMFSCRFFFCLLSLFACLFAFCTLILCSEHIRLLDERR